MKIVLLLMALLGALFGWHDSPRRVAISVPAATFTVNSLDDAVDLAAGDGLCDSSAQPNSQCTLRAAIQETNALAGADTIMLPAGVYTLTIAGIGEDFAATGDLDVRDSLTLSGAGAPTTIIDGGALDRVFHLVTSGSMVQISGVTIRHGNAMLSGAGGGLMLLANTHLLLADSVVRDSVSPAGGGIFGLNTSHLTVSGSSIELNTSDSSNGGGIDASGTVTITASAVISNTAVNSASGGGINVGAGGQLLMQNSTLSGNQATNAGGAIFMAGNVTLSNVTITANLGNSDLSGGTGSGGVQMSAGILTLQNTVLAGNHQGVTELSPDCNGSPTSLGYNLVGNNRGCALAAAAGDQIGTQANPLNARLGPLGNHGGATLTHAPLAGSRLIDRGNPAAPGSGGAACETADQTGLARPGDGNGDGAARCDSGAVESLCLLRSDFNHDLAVTVADIQASALSWLSNDPVYDLDYNGLVNVVDISLVTADFGYTCPPSGPASR